MHKRYYCPLLEKIRCPLLEKEKTQFFSSVDAHNTV